ncbi:MAG: hypothetical protein CMJ81_07585 [Planctomycetaceae bacterium]|nr:hypothetical protein [Planctomycetaceae bacterium]MBP61023.1 hypothetical protein [Planctomycetaceae bacterium]
MVVEELPLPFIEWLVQSFRYGLAAVVVFLIGSLFFGYLLSTFRYGASEGFYLTARVMFRGVGEFFQISPRRIIAMATLAFKEAIRRRVLVSFAVFIAILLFAGWFLDTESTQPGQLYISFVLTSSNFLVLALVLLLSVFSLPTDIKQKTIYTVVTKPVRAWEVVLGRIAGFCAIGTLILLAMGVFSYWFVVRGLAHNHVVNTDDIRSSELIEGGLEGETLKNKNHFHSFPVDANDQSKTDMRMGHWHGVTRQGEGENTSYRVGPAQDGLVARVPQYGKLRFLDRTGALAEPISVGYEWTYRGYFEGGTLAAAIWRLEGITPEKFSDGLEIFWSISVFRTHKGDIEKGVSGSWTLAHPENDNQSPPIPFESKEFSLDSLYIEREFELATGETVDIFKEYADDKGRMDFILRCDDRGQYFGVAQADFYQHVGDRNFAWNFAKGYLSIWIQMTLVIGMGVMFSTFLSAPVALLATLGSVVMGFFTSHVKELALSVFNPENSTIDGGGPIESLIRLVNQMNVSVDLDLGFATTVIQALDAVIMAFMWAFAVMVPDFSRFDMVRYVAEGFNVPADVWCQQLVAGLAYSFVVTCLGYFLLRTREIAA